MKNFFENPTLLYHWSPTTRRKQISKLGLVPGSRSLDGAWKPPYVCFADSPSMGWALSGALRPDIDSWDLWMTWSTTPKGFEIIPLDGSDSVVKEVRVYQRIYKRDIWYVATRFNKGEVNAAPMQ